MTSPEPIVIPSNHGKGIGLTTGFFGVLAFVVIICTALPLAVTTSKNQNNSTVQEASGYAWAAFVFEILSVTLISVAMYFYYQCVNADQTRTKIWNTRYDSQTTMLAAGATSVQQGATSLSQKALGPPVKGSADVAIGSPTAFRRGPDNQWATANVPESAGLPAPLDASSTYQEFKPSTIPTYTPEPYKDIYVP